jgi:hypothetical protein
MNSKRTKLFSLFIGLTILCGLNGCATVDQKIGLNYARQNDSIIKHTGDIVVSHVESSSISKNASGEWVIGSLNNVHGVHQADLLSDRSPGEWIAQALLHELKQSGYAVSSAAMLPTTVSRGILVSDIELLFQVNKGTVSTDTKHGLKFNVSVFRNGSKTKTFSVASRDDRTIPLIASAEDKEKILLHSLQDSMSQLIPDIITLIDKK